MMKNLINNVNLFYKLSSAKLNLKLIKGQYNNLVTQLNNFNNKLTQILSINKVSQRDLHDHNLSYKSMLGAIIMIFRWLLESFYFDNAAKSLIGFDIMKSHYMLFTSQRISYERLISFAEIITKLANKLKSEINNLPILAEEIENEEGDMIRYYENIVEIFEKIYDFIKDIAAILDIDFNIYIEFQSDFDHLTSFYREPEKELSEEEMEELMGGYN